MHAKLAPPLTLTLALVGLLVLVPGAASSAAPNAWDEPITLSVSGADGENPQLVSDGSTITAIWTRSDGLDDRLQASSSTDGGTNWSTPVDVSAAGGDARNAQLVTDGDTITAIWTNDTTQRIQASSSTDSGVTWSATPVNLSAAGGEANDAQLATDGATITAVWTRYDGSHYRIQASSSIDGGVTWSVTPVNLSAAGGEAYEAQLVTDGATITAIWNRFDGSHFRIQASSSIDRGVTWSVAAATLSTAGQNAYGAQLVTDGTTTTAVWARYDGNNDIVQASTSTNRGVTWSTTPVNLTAAGEEAFDVQLVTDGNTITAVWTRFDDNNDIVQASSSTDGGLSWSPPVNLSATGEDAYEPQLVTDGNTITAVWEGYGGTNYRVQASFSTDGGLSWSPPVNLSAVGGDAFDQQLVTDGDTITVIWTGEVDTDELIQVSSFTAVAAVDSDVAAPELAATGLGDQTTTLGVLALILMLGGITVVGARTMTQRTTQHLSPRS